MSATKKTGVWTSFAILLTLCCFQTSLVVAEEPFDESTLFPKNATILFQGDSITDGNRGRSLDPNHILGHGYAFLLASALGGRNPEANWTFLNRGVSGDDVGKLRARWDQDAIAIKPDALSIMIGVNDFWRGESVQEYRDAFDELLSYTKEKLPETELIIIEPFTTLDSTKRNKEEMAEYRRCARELAEKYDAIFVPTQEMFDAYIAKEPSEKYWIWDGVHPTYNGHWLLYEAWLKAVKEAKLAK